jgi:hypothetical protein
MKSLKKFVFLMVAILATFSMALPVQAQSGDTDTGWGEFFQPDGTLQPGVVDAGEVSQPADWMPDVGPLGNWGITMEATYHVYVAADGSTMMTPTASTLFFMAMNPVESGLVNANGEMGMGQGFAVQAAGSLAGGNTTPQQLLSNIILALSGDSDITQVEADQFADALINNQDNTWAFLDPRGDTWNIFQQLLTSSLTDQNVYLLAMIYDSCTNSPTGCPDEVCQTNPEACGLPPLATAVATPVATQTPPPSCPGPSISQGPPSLSISATAPNYPLVVGQDPDKRGADIQASVSIPPVIYTWFEPIIETERVCQTEADGVTVTCRNEQKFKGCRTHRESLPEQITSSRATASLSQASRDWIVHDLGATWYGAYVHQGSFDLKRYGSPATGCSGGTCSFRLTALQVPFADPGIFNLLVSVNTAGTFFNGRMITNPRILHAGGEVKIWVILPSLIDASTSGGEQP